MVDRTYTIVSEGLMLTVGATRDRQSDRVDVEIVAEKGFATIDSFFWSGGSGGKDDDAAMQVRWDGAVDLSKAEAGSTRASRLDEGDCCKFTLPDGVGLSDIRAIGIRATETSVGDGRINVVAEATASAISQGPPPDEAGVFERRESQVRGYCRRFPVRFDRAVGAMLHATDGRIYIDFLAGCSSLNYGHNDPDLKAALLDYVMRDGIAHGLDMFTEAKAAFLTEFEATILRPRGLDYRLQFTGPTGANAVEAALKLARKVTGRHNVLAFTNGFHGVTLGALAATGNGYNRGAAGLVLPGVTRMPYDGYFGEGVDTADYIDRMLADPSGGVDAPAAVIVEGVQGEGGLNVASAEWLRRIAALCRRHGALLIMDEIQAGCGRTGRFFSFEDADIVPDIVTMAKSLSGMGLPMSMVLIRPEHDKWRPGEHNGTFRGNCHAFVTARAALAKFWSGGEFQAELDRKARFLSRRLHEIAASHPGVMVKGKGMMMGIDVGSGEVAARITADCFDHGLVIETSGGHDHVVKVLAPLTIGEAEFSAGLDILEQAVAGVLEPRTIAAQ